MESPSPQERRLEPAKVSLEVENACVRFKTTVENPCLYAVGIKCADSAIPRPLRVPLKCEVFCLYRKFVDETTISLIPIKIYVGLHLQIVTKVSVVCGDVMEVSVVRGDVMEVSVVCGDVMEVSVVCGDVMEVSVVCGDVMEVSFVCGDVMEVSVVCGDVMEVSVGGGLKGFRSEGLDSLGS